MPSHLTRHVFRRILANEPILHRGCLRQRAYSTTGTSSESIRKWAYRDGSFAVARPQRRTLFNFNMFAPKKRQAKEADIDPGIEEMMYLVKVQRVKARLPPPEDIAAAFAAFAKHKLAKRQPMTDTQAKLALQALRYCNQSDRPEDASPSKFISNITLDMAARAVAYGTEVKSAAHLELSKEIFNTLKDNDGGHRLLLQVLRQHCRILGATGNSLEARQLVIEQEKTLLGSHFTSGDEATQPMSEPDAVSQDIPVTTPNKWKHLWAEVFRGVSLADDEAELLSTLEMLKVRKLNVTEPRISKWLFNFYLRNNRVQELKHWFSVTWRMELAEWQRGLVVDPASMAHDMHRVLQWCLQNNDLEYGHQAVREAMSHNPPKQVWDAIFVWAAGTGKGADEIGRMLTVMEKSNDSISNPEEWRLPDNVTINGLVEFATSKNDPYLAERFITLGKERGIEPDARTYQLQIDYRLKINDVDGALIAYKNLQTMDLITGEDIPTVNKLIVALCRNKRHDFDTVMNVAMDLSDRRATFEPETVSTLALLHLSRDEMADVIDLLNTHAHHYSSAARDSIRDVILAFCLDPKTPTSRSWGAYTVIRQVFDETPRPQREDMMKNFFKRDRPDMAVNIFNEMRRHSRPDTIPTVDTYVAAFLGSAKMRDLDSLEVLHNQLKLDYNIDVTTYLNNALILAYMACGEARKALTFWSNIAASKEGPTYNSIHIALRACEKAPFGDIRAKEIWEKLRKMNVDLDQSMWASYVAALAGNGDNELAITTVEQAEANGEVEVDTFLIGSLCAGANTATKQEEIEEWAKEKYPDVWAELEQLGSEIEEEEGRRMFKIDRSLTP